MEYSILLDDILIGMGLIIIVLSVAADATFLIPIGVGAAVIGMTGLEAKSIKQHITESNRER